MPPAGDSISATTSRPARRRVDPVERLLSQIRTRSTAARLHHRERSLSFPRKIGDRVSGGERWRPTGKQRLQRARTSVADHLSPVPRRLGHYGVAISGFFRHNSVYPPMTTVTPRAAELRGDLICLRAVNSPLPRHQVVCRRMDGGHRIVGMTTSISRAYTAIIANTMVSAQTTAVARWADDLSSSSSAADSSPAMSRPRDSQHSPVARGPLARREERAFGHNER